MQEAVETDTTPCPAESLAKEASYVIRAYSRADEKASQLAGPALNEVEYQLNVLWDRLEGIEARASHLAAKSGAGASFQVGLILKLAHLLSDDVVTPEQTVLRNDGLKAIDRMCYSLLDFIVRTTGESFDEICAEYYMDRGLNPHALVGMAMAA